MPHKPDLDRKHIQSEESAHWIAVIIDDVPDNLAITERVLTFAGARVYSAMNGVEGLKILEHVQPTFILLDLAMRVMDGWETLARIRENPATKHIPVIAVTAHVASADRERALEHGFNGYIAKPFSLATLIQEIKACLQAKESGASNANAAQSP